MLQHLVPPPFHQAFTGHYHSDTLFLRLPKTTHLSRSHMPGYIDYGLEVHGSRLRDVDKCCQQWLNPRLGLGLLSSTCVQEVLSMVPASMMGRIASTDLHSRHGCEHAGDPIAYGGGALR